MRPEDTGPQKPKVEVAPARIEKIEVPSPTPQLSDAELIQKSLKRQSAFSIFKWTLPGILSGVLPIVFLVLYFLMPSVEKGVEEKVPETKENVSETKRPNYIPRVSRQATTSLFTLSGITFSGGQPLALVNNQVVAVGDRLKENAVVKVIQAEQVILDYQGKEVVLSMK